MNTAKQVREKKMLRPNDFCLHPLCLWRTQTRDGYKPCPKHSEAHGVVPSAGGWESSQASDLSKVTPTASARCPVCSGIGTVRVSRQGRIVTRADCGECRGTGRVAAPTLRQMAERQMKEFRETGRVTLVGDEPLA